LVFEIRKILEYECNFFHFNPMFSFFKQENILLQKMFLIDISHYILWLLFVWLVLVCGSAVVTDFFNTFDIPHFTMT